jgi:hypothetical protein
MTSSAFISPAMPILSEFWLRVHQLHHRSYG